MSYPKKKSSKKPETAFHELRGLLQTDDECHPGLICVDEIYDKYETMLAALKLASISCGFNRLNTAAQKRVRAAIAAADSEIQGL